MSPGRLSGATAFVSGALFGAGLLVSGMTRPEKVIGFLDVLGSWDPSLAFVMIGAIAVHFAAQRLVHRRAAPLLAAKWSFTSQRNVDLRLVAGAAIFGAGWGVAGYCPGPAVTSLASGGDAILFVVAMLVGTYLAARVQSRSSVA